MPITATTLTRAAGAAAVTAGLVFVAVQVKHPEVIVDLVQGTQSTVRQSMTVADAQLDPAGAR